MNSLLRCGDCMPKKFLQRNCTNIDELLTGGKFYPSPPLIFRELPIILRMHQNALKRPEIKTTWRGGTI